MLDRLGESEYRPDPRLCRILDMMFIIYAEHELNCSTAAMRQWGSTALDPYTALAGAAGALYGPSHGGANEAALRMLQSIGTVDQVPKFIADVKAKKTRLMGFGHRVYKSYDPRARILKRITSMVRPPRAPTPAWSEGPLTVGPVARLARSHGRLDRCLRSWAATTSSTSPWSLNGSVSRPLACRPFSSRVRVQAPFSSRAQSLGRYERRCRIALSDEYFISRNLYPNVDFYSGLIYKAIGFPAVRAPTSALHCAPQSFNQSLFSIGAITSQDMFPVLFLIPRAAGWLAHWTDQLREPTNKMYRPEMVWPGLGRGLGRWGGR